jgi:hypothetical protein
MTIRNLKVLGLALAAVFAMSALTASAASAQTTIGKLTVASGTSATLDGTETGVNRITAFGGFVECFASTVSGGKYRTTPHQSVPAGASEITLTPNWVNCTAVDGLGSHKATVTMKTCDYEARIGETTGGVANTYGLSIGVKCDGFGDTIQIDVYAFSGSELGGIQCTVKIKAQEDLTGAHLTTDTVNDDLSITGEITNIHAERSGSGCATETTAFATQDIGLTVKGTDGSGNNVGITVTH